LYLLCNIRGECDGSVNDSFGKIIDVDIIDFCVNKR
jgi:hypothetical protein